MALSSAIKDVRKDLDELARARLAVIEPKLSRLTVNVSQAAQAQSVIVTVDGGELRPSAWGIPTPIDPGAHRVEGLAAGLAKWSAIVIVGDNADKKQLEVPGLSSAAPGVAPPPPVCPTGYSWNSVTCAPIPAPQSVESTPAAPTPSSPAMTAATPPPPRETHYSTWRYVDGAATLVLLGVSGITGALALADHSKFTDKCLPDRSYCNDPSAESAAAAGTTMAWVSTATLGVGLVGAAAFLFWPRERTSPTVGVTPYPGGAGVSVGGAL